MRRARFAASALLVVASGLSCRIVPRRPPRQRAYLAAFKGDAPAVTALLRKDPSLVRARYVGKVTLLHVAAVAGHADVAELLAGKGADIDAVDEDGVTPLCWAARGGHADVVKVLLARGADARAGADPIAAADNILIADMLREKLGRPLAADPATRTKQRFVQDGHRRGGASSVVLVGVDPDGHYHVGGKRYELEEIGGLIEARAEESPKDQDGLPSLAVKITAGLDCEYAHIQKVMLKCMKAYVWRVSFGAVRKPGDTDEREGPRDAADRVKPPGGETNP